MSYHTPARSTRKHWYQSLDWPFVAAVTAFILVSALVWGLVRSLDAAADAGATNRSLSSQVEHLQSRIDAASEEAKQDRQSASDERDKLLRQQEIMIRVLRRAGIVKAGEIPKGIVIVRPGQK